MLKYGVDMQLPEGKRPGYYAQFVKALAAKVRIEDRDKELLIVNSEEDCEALLELMDEYRFEYEQFDLLALPQDAEVTPLFVDYGFESVSDNTYLYGHLCAVFKFAGADHDAEPEQALEQMQEHLVARFAVDGETLFAVDQLLTELMHGIANAYRCKLEFIYGG
ncbi:MAG: hypothetical protein K0R28_2429 [Paenibacillus sp.]|jgi:hypothetical protein|nr:hypothetical protein [Paenibacillus sp.]